MMISTSANYHWIKGVTASTYGDAALKLTFRGDPKAREDQFNEAEVTLFMEDAALVDRLIAAINGAAVDPEQTSEAEAA